MVEENLSYIVRGIFYEVHNELGQYRNEKQYCDLIEYKLKEKGLKYEREKILEQCFVGEKKGRNRIDFIVENKLIIEAKANHSFSPDDFKQCKRYLSSSHVELCLLVNFGLKSCAIKRILNFNLNNRKFN